MPILRSVERGLPTHCAHGAQCTGNRIMMFCGLLFGDLVMPIGKCALCLLQKDLQKSHLIPASMFRIIRKSQSSDPVFMTAKHIGTSSRQITAHELCWDCEQLFRQNGEDWMAGQVFQGNHFPLLNSFKYAMADWEMRDHAAYSGTACGTDVEKIVYFGTSVLWRSSLRRWTIGSAETTTVSLGQHQEALRKYLHGEAAFPGAAVIVTLCTDFSSQGFFFSPTAIRDGVLAGYSINLLGVYYRFFFEPGVPRDFYRYSCVHSERKRIIVADQSKQSMHSYAYLRKTATESPKLAALSSSL
jgi:hypothetical protein